MVSTPPCTLMGALPIRTRPPQLPAWREPGSITLVNTMGAAAVPCASIFALLVMASEVL